MKERGPRANEGQEGRVIQRMRLENTNDRHYKFYQVDICYNEPSDMYYVEATWGPIGTSGRYQVKGQGKDLGNVVDNMDRVLVQKLFKRGYSMTDVKRWPHEARKGDEGCFVDEDWD